MHVISSVAENERAIKACAEPQIREQSIRNSANWMMMELKHFTLLTVVLAIFACHTFGHFLDSYDDSEEWCPPDDNNNNNNNNNNNTNRTEHDASLCANFQHIRDLINQDTLRELIDVHYNCDPKFRRAMRYYDTPGFTQVTKELTDTAAYKTVLRELESEHVDVADIESVADIFHCIILPVQKPDRNCDCKAVKHHTFVDDLLKIMPHQEVHNYVAESRANHTNFGNFTTAVVSKTFQATLKANIKKRDVVKPLRTLRKHGWDIPELLRAMLTIFQW